MGEMVEGVWQPGARHETEKHGGRFERAPSEFRNWVTPDGAPGPSGRGGFKAEPDRYHLYVAAVCPWANRAIVLRALKGLQNVISMTTLMSTMSEGGWTFPSSADAVPRTEPDPLYSSSYLYELYSRADPKCNGRATVPVLWDKQEQTIVSNESSEIIRMLNTAFNAFADNPELDLYPESLRSEIDEVNTLVYESVNNGVYKCGFATSQSAYEEAYDALFATLDKLEERLSTRRYLAGNVITEADWRCYPTLLRFDVAYYHLFKCNHRRIADYPNLFNYLLELYQVPGVSDLVNLDDIKNGYYSVLKTWFDAPFIVPVGPEQDFFAAHDRGRLSVAA
jgi:putative glutathione S-transferase